MKTTCFIRIGLVVACCLPATLKADDLFILTGSSVALFDSSGTLINQHFIPNVSGPAIYISGNDIFIPYSSTSAGNGGVGEYTTSGATVNASLITGLNGNLGDVAVSGNDIFVVNNTTGSIGEYTTSGATVNASLISINNPTAMAISGNDLYVNVLGYINEYTTSGATIAHPLINPSQYGPGGMSGAFAVVPVPEPTTVGLLLSGAAACLARYRRKA